MTNYMKFNNENIANISLLKVDSGKTGYSRREMVKISERFLNSATLLPENEMLGLQISADTDGAAEGYAFSSPEVNVTTEDFDWIFKTYGTVDGGSFTEVRDMFEGDRKVFTLISVQGSSKDTIVAGKKENCFYDGYDTNPSGYFSEMFTMLMEQDAMIRIVAGPASGNTPGHGMILFSLPGEMSLRMQTAISLAFPHTMAEEIEFPEETEEEKLLPDELLLDGMTSLLFLMVSRESEEESGDYNEFEYETEDTITDDETCKEKSGKKKYTTFTPIEDLDLSVRSYNCLKRAGVDSAEEFLMMTDEDLMHIRNLGKKSIIEVKEKIAEAGIARRPIPLAAESYMDMLNGLIGLEGVKEQVRKIAAFAKMKKDMADKGNDNLSMALNMEFVGNPGTAKTTVARIVAGIFNEIGLLSDNGLLEVGRADLVGQYAGETATKVKKVFQKAWGKVLFIDEAYSLVECWEGGHGDEAINTIVQEMENNREDTVVIFAGYPDKMEEFFARNPGLRSRVPFSIAFKDYSADELLQIVEFETKKRGFSVSPQAKDKVLSICEAAAGNSECGNGRFCRNLVEDAIMEYAVRAYEPESSFVDAKLELDDADFHFPNCSHTEKLKNPIGFSI